MQARDKILKELYQVNLSEINVELALVDDINKILDGALGKQRNLITQGLKISEQLLALTVDYQTALSISIAAANKAKDLGISDAEKMFRVRAEEARDFGEIVGKVSVQIETALRSI